MLNRGTSGIHRPKGIHYPPNRSKKPQKGCTRNDGGKPTTGSLKTLLLLTLGPCRWPTLLSQFVSESTYQDEVLFFPNPTTAISNIIYNLDLKPGDEVLMTDHEYGALVRAWNAWGEKAKVYIKYAKVTLPLDSKDKFFEDIQKKISPKT